MASSNSECEMIAMETHTSIKNNMFIPLPLESQLEPVDFEMALDVEEQARFSWSKKRMADGEYKYQSPAFDVHVADELEPFNKTIPENCEREWHLPLQHPASAPLPEPEVVENSSVRDAQDGKTRIMDGIDDTLFYFEQGKVTDPIKCATAPHSSKSSLGRPHRRNTSQSSFTSTSSGTGISRRTHSIRLKSPYLGPVAWTVPPKNSSQISKPFLIYQDPPWLEPPDVVVDTWGYIATSDNKENCPHHQLHYSGLDLAGSGTPEAAHVDGGSADIAEQLLEEDAVASAENTVHLAPRRGAPTSPDNQHHSLSSSLLGQQHDENLRNSHSDSWISALPTSPDTTGRNDDYPRAAITPSRELELNSRVGNLGINERNDENIWRPAARPSNLPPRRRRQ